MSEKERYLQKINEEFVKFVRMMEELHLLKYVARDLKNFRDMIKIRKYD